MRRGISAWFARLTLAHELTAHQHGDDGRRARARLRRAR